MACDAIKWIPKVKKVYNVDTWGVENLTFLRLNQIDDYNNTIGGVDIADQLRGTYRPDHWLRNRKWWWAIWNWSLGLQLVNAYKIYVNLNLDAGKKMKDLVSHHDFRKSIALTWINLLIDTNPSQEIVISRKSQRDQEDVSVSSSVTMSTIQSIMRPTRGIKFRTTAVNDASIASTSNLSRLRLDKTLDHMQDIRKECSLHRWVGFEL